MTDILNGFAEVLTPGNLLYAALGVLLGTAVGVLPGLGPTVTMALLLPVTYVLDPTAAFIMFAGIYYGAAYGGSTTSIMLNTPGESTAVITTLDGFPMAKSGRAGAALLTAAIGSFVAGTIGTVLLIIFAPRIADLAKNLQPADFFALIVLALVGTVALLGRSLMRGLASLFLGLALSTVGTDALTGQSRLTFGITDFSDGLDIAIIAVGLFAVGEVLHGLATKSGGFADIRVQGRPSMTREDWSRSWRPWLRGTGIGFAVGSLPIGGGDVATVASYSVEKKLARGRAHEFGTGAIEGVAGPEAANNASATGSFIPLLSLGLPTSNSAAILLIAFQIYALQPGPLLFQNSPEVVWPLLASMFLGNILLVLLNVPLIRVWLQIAKIPPSILSACVLLLACFGAYSLNGSYIDVILVIAIGVVGMLMRLFDFPLVPVVMGLVLGGYLETFLRQSLQASQGDPTVFLTRPMSATLLVLTAILLIAPAGLKMLRVARQKRSPAM